MVDQESRQQAISATAAPAATGSSEGGRVNRRGTGAGRGPRGYRRRDASIREELCESLTDSPDLDASDLDVTVQDGEITLTGTVEDRDARWLAEDLAESVSGVRAVHNRLRVAHA
jgi:osmotically-inducible protein OsmY